MLEALFNAIEIKNLVVSERMKVYEASYSFKIENAPQYDYFSKIIEYISARDRIKITLEDSSERLLYICDKREEEYQEYIKDTFQDDVLYVKVRIDKEVKNNYFSIYSYDEFTKDILKLSIEDIMIAFSTLLKNASSFLVFDVYCPIPMFSTKTMLFVPHGNKVINSDFNRLQRIQDCKEASYFYNFDVYEVLPDDFKIVVNYEDNPFTDIFQKITVLLSISFIATSSTMKDGVLKGIINGQRTMEYICKINDLTYNKVLYAIYNWVYTGGNSIDKAMIARNVISLHCKYVPISDIDDKVMASIQSNYNLYLKENVKEYLELKNKVAEFICDIVAKTGEYATSLLDKFKSNIIAIFGFIFSVVLANIVSDQPLDNIFTNEITMLLYCVLAGSFAYLVICFFQSRYEIKKVYSSYEQLKQNYVEILTPEDIKEIFKDDNVINSMKDSISKSEKVYLAIWIFFLLLTFIAVEILSKNPLLFSEATLDCVNEFLHKLVYYLK